MLEFPLCEMGAIRWFRTKEHFKGILILRLYSDREELEKIFI